MEAPEHLVICIAARNEAESLPRLIGLLRSSTLWSQAGRRSIWVALNDCQDDSRQRLEALQCPELRILELAEPGKNAAWNALRQACAAEWMFFVDAEVAPAPDCLERLWRELRRQPGLQLAAALPVASLDRVEHPDSYQCARVDYAQRFWLRQGSGAALPRANCYALRPPQDFRLPEHPNLGDDLFLSLSLSWRVVEQARVYVTPPGRADHLRQRIRQRLGLRALKRDFPELAAQLGRQRGRLPRFQGLAEAFFWLRILAVEREAARQAARRDADVGYWPRIHSARPAQSGTSAQPAAPFSLRARLLGPVQRLVVRTQHWRLWPKVYEAVAELARRVLEGVPGVERLRLQGSLARSRPVAGLSDIDADVILRDLPAGAEADTVAAVLRRYNWLRWCFPILQEPTLLRRSECTYSQRVGEPWSRTSRYREEQSPLEPNRQAYLGLFLRRYLRFYTRQALAGPRRGVDRYIKLHEHELASVQALLLHPDEQRLTVEPLRHDLELGELYHHYRSLQQSHWLAADPERLGPRLASLAFGLLRRLAGPGTVERGPQRRSLPSWLVDGLAPLRRALADDEVLGRFPQVLSAAGATNFQQRFYLLVPETVDLEMVARAWVRLRQIWREFESGFPKFYFGAFPHPSLLPEAALRLMGGNFLGGLEAQLLELDGWRLSSQPQFERDLAEVALPGLRRWHSRRDRLRWLDCFAGLLPAALLWLERGQLHLDQAEASRAYRAAFDDDYAGLLDKLPEPLWFEGPHWRSDLPRRGYLVLRRQIDRLMALGDQPAGVAHSL